MNAVEIVTDLLQVIIGGLVRALVFPHSSLWVSAWPLEAGPSTLMAL